MKLMIYGLQRSGTNYLRALLQKKYRLTFLNGADRHNYARNEPANKHFRLYKKKGVVPEPKYLNSHHIDNFSAFETLLDEVPDNYIVLSKSPYSWYQSYLDWAERCDWPSVSHHYIEEYNLFYGKWLQFSRDTNRIHFVRYIDLLENGQKVLENMQEEMGLQKKWYASLLSNTIRKVSVSASFSKERRDYYLHKRYLDRYTPEELAALNDRLDGKVAAGLGYEIKKSSLPDS